MATDTDSAAAAGDLEFWFDLSSNYSYISVMRIQASAARLGVRVLWRPFLLGPIFRSLGWETSPFVLQKAKGDYVWKDMVRECRKADIPWSKPSVFPRSAMLPLRVAVLGANEAWIAPFCQRIMSLNFAEDRDIDDVAAVSEVLRELSLSPQEIIEAALSSDNKVRLREQTEQARIRGIFGAPTFLCGDEMFWGNDRLDDALVCCSLARL